MAQVGKRKELNEDATYEVIPVKKEKLSYEDIVAEIIEESLDCDVIESESKKLVAVTEEESSECEIIKSENRKLVAEIKEESSDCEIIKSECLKVVPEIKEESSDCEIIEPESMKLVAEMPENIKLEEETPFTFVSCDEGFEESKEEDNAIAENCPLGTSAPDVGYTVKSRPPDLKSRKFTLLSRERNEFLFVYIFECIYCGKYYQDRNVMKVHAMSHSEVLSSSKILDCFKRVSNPPWPQQVFDCEVCNEIFEDRNKLVKHKFIHSARVSNLPWPQEVFDCEVCNEIFEDRNKLVKHKFIHRDLKPFKCRICSYRFSQEAILNIHMRIHQWRDVGDT